MDINKSITINQSLARVWKIMATDYTKVGEWTTQIAVSKPNHEITTRLDGAPAGGRVCTAPGFGDVKETITHFDEQDHYFRYSADISSMPFFVKGIANGWQFRALGPNTTQVDMKLELELNAFPGVLMAPMMRAQLAKTSNIILKELKYYAENGRIHPNKANALKKAGRLTATA
ncbi:MAG: SRPBCC family protein [Deinococcota bacterium]